MQRPPESPCGLDGEIALITGGATGIGYGIAKAFTAMGAKVGLAGRYEAELRRRAHSLRVDLTRPRTARRTIAALPQQRL